MLLLVRAGPCSWGHNRSFFHARTGRDTGMNTRCRIVTVTTEICSKTFWMIHAHMVLWSTRATMSMRCAKLSTSQLPGKLCWVNAVHAGLYRSSPWAMVTISNGWLREFTWKTWPPPPRPLHTPRPPRCLPPRRAPLGNIVTGLHH